MTGLWQPMLPMRRVAKRWDELSVGEQDEIARQYPNWTMRELASVKWEFIRVHSATEV
jgi:hypothetical protein